MTSLFDVVICHGPNDDAILAINLAHVQKNIVGHNKIYVITHDINLKVIESCPECIIIHESIFPFHINYIKKFVPAHRAGWYLQQLLKLYASVAIPELCSYYLVIDADTIFLKPTTFFNQGQLPLYNVGTEYHTPYFAHMKRLHPTLEKQSPNSGICHNMLFNRDLLQQLFSMVENYHFTISSSNQPFWQLFIEHIDPNQAGGSGASEYEIYFNYLLIYHKNTMCIRTLPWENVGALCLDNASYSYISYHHYSR